MNKLNDAVNFTRDSRLANAFLDMEGRVCELKNMAAIMETVIDKGLIGGRTDDRGGYVKLLLSKSQLEAMDFAVGHLADMIREFQKRYYEDYEAGCAVANVEPCRVPSNQTQ